MKDIIIGIFTTVFVVAFLEIFRSFRKQLIAAFTLSGIAFIYIGFAWADPFSLGLSIAAVAVFLLLAYFGYTRDYRLIVAGLLLHGTWDIVYPHFSTFVPAGYDLFCITIDILLALYFYRRLSTPKNIHSLNN